MHDMTEDNFEEKRWFQKLYNMYSYRVYRIAYNILRNNEDSQDAVQEVFMKVNDNLQKLYNFSMDKMTAYIVITTKRVAINMYRVNKRDHERFTSVDTLESEICSDESVYDKIDYDDLVNRIKCLPPRYQEAMMLHYVSGYTGDEAAKIMGVSRSTLYEDLKHAKELLRKELIKHE